MSSYAKAYSKRKRVYGSAYRLGKSDAQKALSIARATAKLVNVEFKHFDVTHESTIGTTGSVVLLTNIPEGDGPSSRDGASVKLKSHKLNISLKANASAVQSAVRVVLVRDNQQQGTNPTIADVLSLTGTSNLNDTLALPNIQDYPGRFTILMDRTLSCEYSNDSSIVDWQYYKKSENHLKFDNSGAGAQRKGAIYMMAFSNQPTNQPTISYNSRIRYLDN